MTFRTIDDDLYGKAGQAIRAARNTDAAYPEHDNAELVASAAALALERGAPKLIAFSYETTAEDYLKQGSIPWRSMHSAVARFIDTDLNESEALSERSDSVKMVVSQVLQQVSAKKVVEVAEIRDFEEFANPQHIELAKMCRSDVSFMKDMRSVAVGFFDRVSDEMAPLLKEALDAPIPGKLGQEVALLTRAVDGIVHREEKLTERSHHADGALGKFTPLSGESLDKVFGFYFNGESTGNDSIDAAFSLIREHKQLTSLNHDNDPLVMAQARLIQENRSDLSMAPADLAAMALSDAAIMQKARDKLYGYDVMDDKIQDEPVMVSSPEEMKTVSTIFWSVKDLDSIGQGNYHELVQEDREVIDRDIVFATKIPAFDRVKLEVAMLENSGIAGIARLHEKQIQEDGVGEQKLSPILAAQHQMAARAQGFGM